MVVCRCFFGTYKGGEKRKRKGEFYGTKTKKNSVDCTGTVDSTNGHAEAVQAFEEVSQPEVQITETAQEGELVSQSDGDDI